MFTETVSPETKRILALLAKEPFVRKYYLAGGTVLALHYGHRISYDLDFFSQTPEEKHIIVDRLTALGKVFIKQNDQGTFNGILDDVKISFFIYPYHLLKPTTRVLDVETASSLDCACMKLDAIGSRGLKRDFYDLYMILHEYTLDELLHAFKEKYKTASTDPFHVLRSLTYFIDAEEDEAINLLKPLEWDTVKTFFIKQVSSFTRERLV
ncbi:MAG TPA: hypothetical protein DCX25_04760 [Candidatus Pacebacteria bacterium]|nr:MAG: hypothetical protein UX00_C0007G0108 [Microgenomates group bacterium GW2011_GWB1_45_17]KKU23364.1 MAG: hypothetical protein UX35_C0006G0040 [Microgenomates group bacterium GW2011_GWA1_46_15]KKU24507.1 MAG: hypothetical protein UX36_C0001G0124 [Microgenomates group bacterium GW2011_GWC1_46_15]HAV15611.1 hypothetical protein [Candidatus Paceibacterota bacterium]HCR11068.1 hypothetical protein [Candidatus Paceibacterota bacterium]